MYLPKKLNILGTEYKVVVSPVPCPHDAPGVHPTLAETVSSTGTIYVYPILLARGKRYVLQTLIHEICHAIFSESGHDEVFNDLHAKFDETIVNTLAVGLMPLLDELQKVKRGRR